MKIKNKTTVPQLANRHNINVGVGEGQIIDSECQIKNKGHDAISYLEGYLEGKKARLKEIIEWMKLHKAYMSFEEQEPREIRRLCKEWAKQFKNWIEE